MAEVAGPDGSWAFDGDQLRVVLAPDRRTRALRQALGERLVPVAAIAGVGFTPGRSGALRLRLREGADPFLQIGGGQLREWFDPYRLVVPRDVTGAAEYLVDEVRNAVTIEEVRAGPTDHYLVAAPAVPLTARGDDGIASFDGVQLRLEWTRWASPAKRSAGTQLIALRDVAAVDWSPRTGGGDGQLRFSVRGRAAGPPRDDPGCLTWGPVRRNRWGSFAAVRTKAEMMGGTTSLLAAAVAARLPHPYAAADPGTPALPGPAATEAPQDDDVLLRRLRELGRLHTDGLLTDEEYEGARQAVLRLLSS